MSSNFQMMGVVNITPDSFSDGGVSNSSKSFKNKIESFRKFNVGILDIGGESTAPFNDPVTEEVELARFQEVFIPNLSWFKDKEITISIDTYRPNVFLNIYSAIQKVDSRIKVIWNDVSGVIDESVLDILKHRCKNCQYVFSHTTVVDRTKTSGHMDNVLDVELSETVNSLSNYFHLGMEKFKREGLEKRVILDPCFGFSKSIEQNHYLIKNMSQLMNMFSVDSKWLLGISRKSFLRALVEMESMDSDKIIQTELLQTAILNRWFEGLKDFNVTFRLHDPAVYSMAQKSIQLF